MRLQNGRPSPCRARGASRNKSETRARRVACRCACARVRSTSGPASSARSSARVISAGDLGEPRALAQVARCGRGAWPNPRRPIETKCPRRGVRAHPGIGNCRREYPIRAPGPPVRASVYVTVSRSGEICRPWISASSAVLPMMKTRSGRDDARAGHPETARRPLRPRAPRRIRLIGAWHSPVMRIPECLTLWRRLSAMSSAAALSSNRAFSSGPASIGAHARNQFGQLADRGFCLRVVAADQRVAIDRMVELSPAPPRSAREKPPPRARPGTSRAACCAAEPSHSVSIRESRPPMAISSGTVASTRIAPGAKLRANRFQRLDLRGQRNGQDHDRRSRDGIGVGVPRTSPAPIRAAPLPRAFSAIA